MTAAKLSHPWAAVLAAALTILAAGCEPPTTTPSTPANTGTPAAEPTPATPTTPPPPPPSSDECFKALGVTCSQFNEAYMKASQNDDFNAFGDSIALSGNTLAVGSSYSNRSTSPAVYVFIRAGNAWRLQQRVVYPGNLGASVALSGDTLAIGVYRESSGGTGVNPAGGGSARQSGAVYIYTRSDGSWSRQAHIKASNTGARDRFGRSLALSKMGNTLAVGAAGEDSNARSINGNQANDGAPGSGAVYVFTRSGTAWSQQAYIKAANSDSGDSFGHSVALSDNTLAVGALGEASSETGHTGTGNDNSALVSGAVYIFTRTGTNWSQKAYLKASNTDASDQFGSSVALSGGTLAVGAVQENSNAAGLDQDETNNGATNSGAVYVFERNSAGFWRQKAYIKASNTGANDRFGSSAALSGDTLVIGAKDEQSNAKGPGGDETNNDLPGSGAVYVFTRSAGAGASWEQKAYIKASNTGQNDGFGGSIALSGGTLAIGAGGEQSSATGLNGDQNNNSKLRSGAVYVRRIAP